MLIYLCLVGCDCYRLVTLTGDVLHEWRSHPDLVSNLPASAFVNFQDWPPGSSRDWIRCGFAVTHVRRPHTTFPFAQAADLLTQSSRSAFFWWDVLGTGREERLFVCDSRNSCWAALYDLRTGERLHKVVWTGKRRDRQSYHCFPRLNVVLQITECVLTYTHTHTALTRVPSLPVSAATVKSPSSPTTQCSSPVAHTTRFT